MKALFAAALFAAAALLGPRQALAFRVQFEWRGIAPCETISPAFAVSGAPRGAQRLRFVMRDEQAPAFHHGGSTVALPANGRVPKGAIHYIGPCPPGSERHTYIWTVEALSGDGRVLATTTAAGVFPPR